MAVTFKELRALFGRPFDDPAVAALLSRCAKVSKGKPDGGDHYVQVRSDGFDFLFRRPDGAKRGSPRLLQTLFLYREGNDRHREFADPPFGLRFTTRPDALKTMGKPSRSWKIGPGEVPASDPGVSHDEWKREGLRIAVMYAADRTITHIQLELEPE